MSANGLVTVCHIEIKGKRIPVKAPADPKERARLLAEVDGVIYKAHLEAQGEAQA